MIIEWIRKAFCQHKWELIEHVEADHQQYSWTPKRHQWIYMCTKCGRKNIIKNY